MAKFSKVGLNFDRNLALFDQVNPVQNFSISAESVTLKFRQIQLCWPLPKFSRVDLGLNLVVFARVSPGRNLSLLG